MNDYSNYSYGRILRFFDAYYPYDNEDIHYSEVIISMNQCSTIDELISIRERLKEKVKKITDFKILPKDIIKELSIINNRQLYGSIQDNLIHDIDSCYDENILRLLSESDNITEQLCGECFINLSYCFELSENKDLIIQLANERAKIDVSELLVTIAKRYESFKEHWIEFKRFNKEMNGYNSAKKVVEEDFEYLKKFKWRLLPWEKEYYFEIDREEQQKKEQLWKDQLIEDEKRREQHDKNILMNEKKRNDLLELKGKKSEKKRDKNALSTGEIIALIIVGGAIGALLASPLGPWAFAILGILLLFKMGVK